MHRALLLLNSILMLCGCASHPHSQVPDKSYRPTIENAAYGEGAGPVICLDEAHFNFHTLEGRFWAFGELARRDGFVVRASRDKFDERALNRCDILVISNAQPTDAEWDTYPSPTPSAFTPEEIEATQHWAESGGNLLLIADHMPLAGAAAELAAAFGVRFNDGFALPAFENESELEHALHEETILRISDGTLQPHPIVRGRNHTESVSSVRTFMGQAFQVPPSAQAVLVLPDDYILLMPDKAWQFSAATKKLSAGGWSQGAVMRIGTGRAAFFGEAAMFSAQLAGTARVGMNAPGAEENYKLVLNVLRWLSGALD